MQMQEFQVCVWGLSALLLTLVQGNSQQFQERKPCQPGRLSWLYKLFLHMLNDLSWHNFIFLIGFYCPLGSFTPVPCPKGTYGPTAGAVSIDSCLKCPPHHYCPRPGLPAYLPCGPAAQQPLSGQDSCVCPGEGQSFQVTLCFHTMQ